MTLKLGGKLTRYFFIGLLAFSLIGCKEKEEKKAAQEQGGEKLPEVTLTAVKVQNDPGTEPIKVVITTSGTFLYSVVPKSDPERIIAILHNTRIGDHPKKLEINDGTITGMEIVQLDTGRGPAVKITINLARKLPREHDIVSSTGALVIGIPRK